MKTFVNSQLFNDSISEYNTALRIAEEDVGNLAGMKVSKSFSLSIIMETFGREYSEFTNFLAGKLDMSNKAFYEWSDRKLFYIEFPESFEKAIANLENDSGDLTSTELAWISNTRKLIQKYHAIAYKQMIEIWPQMAEPEEDKKKESEKQKAARALQSKACKIANRIKGMDRKEAFTSAWKIAKAGGLEIKLVGVSFYSRQEALKRLTAYDPKDIHAILVPEFDNPYDANAIAVKVLVNGAKATYRLGYVPKTETGIAKAFLGKVPELTIINGDIRGAKVRIAA
jgi:hypothetical protein